VFSKVTIYIFSNGSRASIDLRLLFGDPRPHFDTPHSIGLLWRARCNSGAVIIVVEPTMTIYVPRTAGEKYVEIWNGMHILQNLFFLYYISHSPSYLFVSGSSLLYRTYYGTSRTGNIEKETCSYILTFC